jgi:hypothetical protein
MSLLCEYTRKKYFLTHSAAFISAGVLGIIVIVAPRPMRRRPTMFVAIELNFESGSVTTNMIKHSSSILALYWKMAKSSCKTVNRVKIILLCKSILRTF